MGALGSHHLVEKIAKHEGPALVLPSQINPMSVAGGVVDELNGFLSKIVSEKTVVLNEQGPLPLRHHHILIREEVTDIATKITESVMPTSRATPHKEGRLHSTSVIPPQRSEQLAGKPTAEQSLLKVDQTLRGPL
jgi:hypothetical protein